MTAILQRFRAFCCSEDGPTATEYAVLLAVISIGTLTAMATFGDRVDGIYLAIAGAVDDAI